MSKGRGFKIHQSYFDREIEDLVRLPQRATDLSAGYDLHCTDSGILQPGERRLIDTGVTCFMEDEDELQIRPRSGLAFKYGVTVLNAPGTVDADYEGNEIKVLLINLGNEPFEYKFGDRIAQAVFASYKTTNDDQPAEQKRTSGFGHTGR